MRGLEQIPWLYDAMCWAYERLGLAPWREWLVAGARGRALDVGCGTGRNLPLYAAGVRVVALDPHWDVLQRARGRAPRVSLVQASAEALPFPDGTFDTVVSGLAFCSVPDPLRGLAEVKRVLGPGGRLRMLEHVRSRRPWKARFQDRTQPVWTRISGGCHPNRDTECLVEASGFAIEEDGRRAKGDMRRFSARPVQ
ncbi:MAG: class I SAM-dependent methyltransferase [Candidatus Rokubacteria bacterium]|nr:class I SAM-dependent methyltransferase [Candidatus Rokubacteria bacterium]